MRGPEGTGGLGGAGGATGGWGGVDTHGGSFAALVDGVGGHVGGGHAVAGPHHRHRHQRAERLAHLIGVTWRSGGSVGMETGCVPMSHPGVSHVPPSMSPRHWDWTLHGGFGAARSPWTPLPLGTAGLLGTVPGAGAQCQRAVVIPGTWCWCPVLVLSPGTVCSTNARCAVLVPRTGTRCRCWASIPHTRCRARGQVSAPCAWCRYPVRCECPVPDAEHSVSVW